MKTFKRKCAHCPDVHQCRVRPEEAVPPPPTKKKPDPPTTRKQDDPPRPSRSKVRELLGF